MRDQLARCEWEDEVILEAIEGATKIPNPKYMGAPGGDPSVHLQIFPDNLRLGLVIEKAKLSPVFEIVAKNKGGLGFAGADLGNRGGVGDDAEPEEPSELEELEEV
ncbi:hypothetical protein K439DRAFT_1613731 [Ramaria rubella]|nr:hypothetical protein K439DRAFT_1613731 [Ramaria rubella]